MKPVGVLIALAVLSQAAGQVDVASVKRNPESISRENLPSVRPAANGVTAIAMTATDLIAFAFDANITHIAGAPAWAGTERFDVSVRATGPTTVDQHRGLLREVLTTRFGLQAHRETRQLPRHHLVRVRGELGPGLKAANPAIVCAGTPPPAAGDPTCRVIPAPGGFVGTAATMPQILRLLTALAAQFGGVDDGVLADDTGLTGRFDVDFRFSAQDALAARTASPGAAPDPAGSTAAFRAAVRDQLGLRLESRLGPVEVLVIDRLEQPMPD